MNTIELIEDVCLFGGGIPCERIDEVREFFDNYKALQLHKTQVSVSVCCDNQNLRWEKKEISIDDKHGSYKDLTFDFCENCGQTFNVQFD